MRQEKRYFLPRIGLRRSKPSPPGSWFSIREPSSSMVPPRNISSRTFIRISTHDQKHPDFDFYVPMIDARRMEVYTSMYDTSNKMQSGVEAMILDENSFADILKDRKLLLCGDGSSKCKGVILSDNCIIDDLILPSSKSMAVISYKLYKTDSFKDTAYFEPFYLKDFIAGKSKVKGLR